MKILIQDAMTGKYLAADGSFKGEPRGAKDFRSSFYAYAVARRQTRRPLRVVCYHEEEGYAAPARAWGGGERTMAEALGS